MELHEFVQPGIVILQPRERLTVETEVELRLAVTKHRDAGRDRVVLDLAHVPYIDSCCLGTIAQMHLDMEQAGGWLKLTNVTGRNRQLLSVTRLLGVIGIYAPEAASYERPARHGTYPRASS